MGKSNLPARDERGRYLPGETGNARGRLPYKKEREYLVSMQQNVPLEDWVAITRKAVAQAKEGNRYAREWLARYLVPEPAKTHGQDGAIVIRYIDNWREGARGVEVTHEQ